jgi:diguanylate cyclase (GGDEF)-like protein
VRDDEGNLLGIVGVGVKMSTIRQVLFDYRKRFNVEVFLIDSLGLVQIHDNVDYIENQNIFNDKNIADIREGILSEKNKLEVFELGYGFTQESLTSQYIEELDLYLLIKKDTSALREMVRNQIISKTIIFLLILIGIILINSQIVNYFHNKITKMSSIDSLTELQNRRIFDQYLIAAIKDAQRNNKTFTLILFDIDNLKQINDKYGHATGDKVIKATADYIRGFIRKNDMLARWGGDEFALIFKCDINTAQKIINRTVKTRIKDPLLIKYNVNTSIGLTEYKPGDKVDSIFERADSALYKKKEESKNKF